MIIRCPPPPPPPPLPPVAPANAGNIDKRSNKGIKDAKPLPVPPNNPVLVPVPAAVPAAVPVPPLNKFDMAFPALLPAANPPPPSNPPPPRRPPVFGSIGAIGKRGISGPIKLPDLVGGVSVVVDDCPITGSFVGGNVNTGGLLDDFVSSILEYNAS